MTVYSSLRGEILQEESEIQAKGIEIMTNLDNSDVKVPLLKKCISEYISIKAKQPQEVI